jgi:hypothetical protein
MHVLFVLEWLLMPRQSCKHSLLCSIRASKWFLLLNSVLWLVWKCNGNCSCWVGGWYLFSMIMAEWWISRGGHGRGIDAKNYRVQSASVWLQHRNQRIPKDRILCWGSIVASHWRPEITAGRWRWQDL